MKTLIVLGSLLALLGCQDPIEVLEENLPKPSSLAKEISPEGTQTQLSVVFTTVYKSDVDCASKAAAPHVKNIQISSIGSAEKYEWGIPFIYRKTQTPPSWRLNVKETNIKIDKNIDAMVDALLACRTDRKQPLTWSVSRFQSI